MKNSVVNDLTIFVNTSDNFEDCWNPFFKLFATYWPGCPFLIVLNTETKDYSYPGLNIRCTKVAQGEKDRLGWSECLTRAFDFVNTPYILYLQEDYFLEEPVNQQSLIELLEVLRDESIGAIQLFGADGPRPFYQMESPLILEVDKRTKWRLSLQSVLWKTAFLRSLVRHHESPWQLESYGSYRTRRSKLKICCLNPLLFSRKEISEIYPYKPTGVVAGKWVEAIVVPLFAKHKIEMDFSQRGFHDTTKRTKKRKSFLTRFVDRIRSLI
jgi:hypothetical protein